MKSSSFQVIFTSVAALYTLWLLLTFRLEGMSRTLLRPKAIGRNLFYTLVVNLIVGIVFAGWLLRSHIHHEIIAGQAAGFSALQQTILSVAIGFILGLMLHLIHSPPSRKFIILLNGFLKAAPLSVAEVLICWALIGSYAEAMGSRIGLPLPTLFAGLIAALLFGVYHIAHSPPYNSLRMMKQLSVLGLFTSAFFFLTRDVYGTIVFHNFIGMHLILWASHQHDLLDHYQAIRWSQLASAVVSIGLLVVV
ncbi:MAG TPA: hypothetical protein VKA68_06465, partial [bacterium]|nr:hypothetical protein [bacterium]